MRARFLVPFAAPALLFLVAGAAQAQEQTDRLVLPVPVLAATDAASSVAIQPANLGFLASWALEAMHSEVVANYAPILGRGEALYVASPLLFGIAVGAGLEYLRPLHTLGLANRGAASLALAWASSRELSLGVSWRGLWSDEDGALDGLGVWDAGATLRPWPWFSVSAVVRNLNAPAYRDQSLGRTWILGLGLRPTGRDVVQIASEVAFDEERRRFTPSASVAVAVPAVGALRAGIELPRAESGTGRELHAQVALEVAFGALGQNLGAGGAVATRRDAVSSWTAFARASGDCHAGIPRPARVVDLPIESELDVRAVTALSRWLDHLRRDSAVDGVLLRVRTSGVGLAAAQEIRRRILALRRDGKKVICHLDDGATNAWALCSAADRIFVDPVGGVRLMGIRFQMLFFKRLLDDLGVRTQFVRFAEYKSAPEAFERTASSEPARREYEELLDDYIDQLSDQIAADRPIPRERVAALIERGPFVAPEAVAEKLVDAAVYEDQIDLGLRRAFGRPVHLVPAATTPEQPRRWSTPPRIAIVYVDGNIVDGRSYTVPLLDMRFAGGRTLVEAINRAAADPSIRAIVVRIDSPGGSALASDQVWRALWRARQIKPVIASMESVAASGGYYIASAAQHIVASAATLTGSIGIFYGKADISGLTRRLGVDVETMRRGARADADSLFRPFTPEEMRMLRAKMHHFYNIFLRKVARGRGTLAVSQVEAVARGRVWSGRQARARHLVDSYGGIAEALHRARMLAGLDDDYEIVELPESQGLLETLLGMAGIGGTAATGEAPLLRLLPPQLRRTLRASAPLLAAENETPMALLPYAIVEP
jgi:protease-4